MQQFVKQPQSLKHRFHKNWTQFLNAVIDEAWRPASLEVRGQIGAPEFQKKMRIGLLARYPMSDMMVLERYGRAERIDEITVRIFDEQTNRWDSGFRVGLGGSILVPDNVSHLYTRPTWWNDPMCGCTPEYWAKLTDLGKEQARERRDKEALGYIPLECEALFKQVLDTVRSHQADKDRIETLIAEMRHTTGVYPTWQDIIDCSETTGPVLASYIGKALAA